MESQAISPDLITLHILWNIAALKRLRLNTAAQAERWLINSVTAKEVGAFHTKPKKERNAVILQNIQIAKMLIVSAI